MSQGVSLLSDREVKIRASHQAQHAEPEPPGRAISSAAPRKDVVMSVSLTGDGKACGLRFELVAGLNAGGLDTFSQRNEARRVSGTTGNDRRSLPTETCSPDH